MKYFILILLSLSACAFHPYEGNEDKPVSFVNAEQDTIDYLEEVINFTNSIAPKPVDMNGYVVELYADALEVAKECGNPKASGCTIIDWHFVLMTWYPDHKPMSAWIMAHEMGHIFYDQTTGNGDGDHKHNEWFDIQDNSSVVAQVYWHYYNGSQ